MRWPVGVALAAALAGCGQKAERAPANQEENAAAATNVEENAPANVASGNEANASAPSGGLGSLPPADAALRFVGLWATSAANCTARPWRFTADALTADGGPSCTFYKVTKVAGGYDLAAQCPAKEPVHSDLIKLRFAESARAMLVESNAIEPTGLVYCGSDG